MLMTTRKYDECFLRAGNILFLDLGAGYMRMFLKIRRAVYLLFMHQSFVLQTATCIGCLKHRY